jgi:ABC-type bacteriocin/lantibiotic exporter with double-glycine peptidase domain
MVHQIIGALIAGIGAILSLTLMFYFDWVLAIISLTGLSIFALVRGLLAAPLRRYSKEELVMKADADGHVLNAINGIGSIKVFGMSSKPRSSTSWEHGSAWAKSNGKPWLGSVGTTQSACTAPSDKSRHKKQTRHSMQI